MIDKLIGMIIPVLVIILTIAQIILLTLKIILVINISWLEVFYPGIGFLSLLGIFLIIVGYIFITSGGFKYNK